MDPAGVSRCSVAQLGGLRLELRGEERRSGSHPLVPPERGRGSTGASTSDHRTTELHKGLLRLHILLAAEGVRLDVIRPEHVRTWHGGRCRSLLPSVASREEGVGRHLHGEHSVDC